MRSRAAICVVTEPGGRVLLTRRSASCPKWPHHWDLPGGYVHSHETLEEGLQREIAEETGLFLPGDALKLQFTYPEESVDVSVFSAQVPQLFTPSFADKEHDRFTWTSWDRLPHPLVQPLDQFPRLARRHA